MAVRSAGGAGDREPLSIPELAAFIADRAHGFDATEWLPRGRRLTLPVLESIGDVPLDLACLVSCGVLAGAGPVFNRAKVPPGASVAVFGCGGVGLNTIQAARMVGAGKIIAVDINRQKLTWAEEFGATHAVDASTEDPVARVHAISGRRRSSRPSPRRTVAARAWWWE